MLEFMKLILLSDQDKFIGASQSWQLVTLNTADRLKLAFKKFTFLFMIALVSVLIPVFHFILVPIFLLLSVFFALKAYQTKVVLETSGQGRCLQCDHSLHTQIILDENLRFTCSHCPARYMVEKVT